MFTVYILYSFSKDKYYIGQTNNLIHRIERHNENRVRATKFRGPWQLLYSEEYATRGEALKRERFLKSRKDRKFIEQIITIIC